MAVRKYASLDVGNAIYAAHNLYYVCDTTAELPSSGLKQGDQVFDKQTNIYYTATSATTLAAVGSAVGTSSLSMNPGGNVNDSFTLTGRAGVGFPVPYFQPNTANKSIAFDIFPKGTPPGASGVDAAWMDICSTDIVADFGNYECLHLAKTVTGVGTVGTTRAGSGVRRPLTLQPTAGVGAQVGIHTTAPIEALTMQAADKMAWEASAGVVDTNLYRAAADSLKTDDAFTALSLAPIGNTGATATTRYRGGTATGAPTTGTWAVGDWVVAQDGGRFTCTAAGTPGTWVGTVAFSKTAAFTDPTAVVAATIAAWTAPFACTVTAIKGYRVGGTGATINAYRGTTATQHRAANLSLTSASTWMDGGAVQNTAYASGDSLLLALISAAGSPTQVSIQVNFTRP